MGKIFRVLGPPGTGKTTYLTKELKLVTQKYGAHNVIVSSFTKAAAQELVGRNSALKRRIGTLHSHAYGTIRSMEVAAGDKLADFNENFPQYKMSGIKNEDDVGIVPQGKGPGDELMSKMNIYRARMVPVEQWAPMIQAFHKSWTEWKRSEDLIDFSDMIEIALQDTDTAPGNPMVGFFDECQDFTPLEMVLVRKWTKGMDYAVLAGDDDQLLYSFLGATPKTLVEGHFDHTKVLDQSYRVPKSIQDRAENWIKKVSQRTEKEYKPRKEEGEVIRSRVTLKNSKMLLQKIESDLAEGMDVMILTTCSYMLHSVLLDLRKEGIPFANKYRQEEGAWNPLKKKGTAGTISDFLLPCEDIHGDHARLWTAKELEKIIKILKSKDVLQHGIKSIYKELVPEDDWDKEVDVSLLLKIFPIESSFWNVMHRPHKEGMLHWLNENMLDTKKRVAKYPMKVIEKKGTLPDVPKVTVGTIHSVKGGQADSVYLFPDLSTRGAQAYSRYGESKDSVIRAFYVGMTRAKKKLTLCHGIGYSAKW
jgi:DNA helicase II / ATP-dependent DNA helicase PcrA